jgi:heme-degrading monooxygenase HmoA
MSFVTLVPKEMTMVETTTATIDARAGCLTLINVYEVEPDNQAKLAEALAEATESTIRRAPGFISVSIHRSLDGRKVVNYAQWASKADFEDFMATPETRDQLKRFAELATSVAPALYAVSSVISAR